MLHLYFAIFSVQVPNYKPGKQCPGHGYTKLSLVKQIQEQNGPKVTSAQNGYRTPKRNEPQEKLWAGRLVTLGKRRRSMLRMNVNHAKEN